ncbi:MAG: rhodanese-like domain-containing protein [Caldilineae bacterium]|nr:MAG: rhodanese-like domain-containing protein [Caldilineae bacterium]
MLLVVLLLLAGCSQKNDNTSNAGPAGDTAVLEPLQLGPDVDVKTVAAVRERPDVVVIDVREQWEYDEAHVPGVTLIPMGTIPDRLDDIPRDKEVIVMCRSGNRSGQVTEFLRQAGFTNVHNMKGGILAWQEAGLPVER